MKKTLALIILSFTLGLSFSQTKVSGYIFDENEEPVPYANAVFKGSIEGTTTDENGKFYLESKKHGKD
tara:strand:+ start:581 stop:784 length:204 start_codon:yes stop_codon:yes gene_type:complete